MNIKVLWCDELKVQLVTWGFLGDFLGVKVISFVGGKRRDVPQVRPLRDYV